MDIKPFLLAILIVVCASDMHRGSTIKFTIPNVTKINIEDEDRIIGGNMKGEIEVHLHQKNATPIVINSTHSGKILFIEQYKRGGNEEYVVVDEKGLITVWDEEMGSKLTSFDLNATVRNVAIREKMEGVKENRLVVNCINQVLQFSLDSRTQLRRYTFNQTIIAVIYTNSALFMSTNQATVLIFAEDGSKIKEILITQGSISLFTKHNHNEWSSRKDQVMGVASGQNAYLLHIMVDTGVDSAYSLGKTQVTSLNFCKGHFMQRDQRIRRRTNDDMLVLGINQQVLQLRTDTNYVRSMKFQQGIRDVACYEEDLFILKGNNQLFLQQLDHSQHSGSKFPAIAGGFLVVLVVAVIAYHFSKRKVEKREKSAQTPNNIELHELEQPIMRS